MAQTMKFKIELIGFLVLVVIFAGVRSVFHRSPAKPTAETNLISTNTNAEVVREKSAEIGEWPFRAGAATAARLIWENPNLYTNNLQVADAAWAYAQPLLKQLRATNSP